MIVNDERVAEVCKLTPSAALELLDKGRAGDAEALAEWSIYAIHRELRRAGAAPSAALHHALRIARSVDFKVTVKG